MLFIFWRNHTPVALMSSNFANVDAKSFNFTNEDATYTIFFQKNNQNSRLIKIFF